MKRSVREAVFFILVFLLFYLTVKLARFWIHRMNLKPDLAYIIGGLAYSLVIIAIYYLASLQSAKEGFWDVSSAALCKGGPYMWQGDSAEAKMCREMASTPDGMVQISGYNCPNGYVGSPGLPFYYTPLSNDQWRSERCEDLPSCEKINVGMCSLEKQE